MRAAGVTPDVVAYTSLLSALHGSPQASSEARRLWASMQAAGVAPNGRTVAAYLDLLLSVGETDEALALLTDAAGLLGRRRRGTGPTAPASSTPTEPGAAPGPTPVIDLPRIYEHFIHVLAARGQHHLVEHLARHRKVARLPLTFGIASALMTAQALRQGRATAKWLLQEEEWQPEGSLEEQAIIRERRQAAADVPDALMEACLLGRGSPAAAASELQSSSTGQAAVAAGPLSLAAINVLIGGLAVQGSAAQAFVLLDWLQQQNQQPQHGGLRSARPDWWTYRLLMFAALNAEPVEQRPDLVLRVLSDSRRHANEICSRGGATRWWDQKTRRAVMQVLQQSERVAGLGLHAGSADDHDAKLAQLRSLLSLRAA